MQIEYLNLVKIDHENNTVSEQPLNDEGNLREYVMEIIGIITDNAGERRYRFKSTEHTMHDMLDAIITDKDRDKTSLDMARRLLTKEQAAQKKIESTKKEIQKGILLIAYCKMTDAQYKIVMCKADYTEIIEEISGEKKNGLTTKKKIFKSFAANVTINAGTHAYGEMVTYDLNSTQSHYWYDEFLDLEAIRDDEKNTERAFDVIKARILNPQRKNHPNDYLVLWNLSVGYMRSEGEFSIDHYADEILAKYKPDSEGLDMIALANKAKQLPDKWDFDSRFQKVPSKIRAKMKNEIKLTDDINLVMKNDIPNLSRTIKAHEEDGDKYIMVRSDDGYKYAIGLDRIEEQQKQ